MRFCRNCQTEKKVENGKYRVFNEGKNRTWVCGECIQNQDKRENAAFDKILALINKDV
jgi:protein-arginine kinase activator protein McsA